VSGEKVATLRRVYVAMLAATTTTGRGGGAARDDVAVPRGLRCSQMQGGEHSSAELTVSVKVPCQECGGRGFVETVTSEGHIVGDTTQECLTCRGRGLIPEDMPLSQFRDLLASDFG